MKEYGILLLACFAVLICPVEGCMRGGISPEATYAIIGICVIFSPILIPAGLTYGTYAVGKHAIKRAGSRAQDRKRTTNLIKKQRNRMVKKVGAQNFENYIQQLFDRTKSEPTPDNFLELGTALFLNNDLFGAFKFITQAIDADPKGEWKKFGMAKYVRGMVNQYLYDFDNAIIDFDDAQKYLSPGVNLDGADNSVPQIGLHDAVNASGYARMLLALYGEHHDQTPDATQVVDSLTQAINLIGRAIEISPEPQGMFYHNRGYTRYHRSFHYDEEKKREEMKLAVADFDIAIGSPNFGTTAEAHSMKAQALAVLGEYDQGVIEHTKALELDPKVFTVQLIDENMLRTPWPLPRDKYRLQENAHSFTETIFHRPHYCDHCANLIHIGQGYKCYACDYKVHKACFPKVKGKDCWVSLNQTAQLQAYNEKQEKVMLGETVEEELPAISNHVHHMKAVRFHKPTWCQICKKLVASPFGKQGYQCGDCGVKIHKNCIDLSGKYFVEQ